mmetsp:Transcript_23474/g.73494  ORF Transcript_23474/g.73494 Transcript_23474/m.73494 type:complete len:218 (-) Transcript_23474:282-935(-)
MMRSAPWWVAAAWVARGVAQDMRGECVGCGDTYRKCELNCVLPKYRPDEAMAWPRSQPEHGSDIEGCVTTCRRDLSNCTETVSQRNCLACVERCAKTYDAAMLDCLRAVDPTSRLSFGVNLDACSMTASSTMDDCSDSCHGTDPHGGWTPEKEEGLEGADLSTFSVPRYRAAPDDLSSLAEAPAEPSQHRQHSSLFLITGLAGLVCCLAGWAMQAYD